MELLRSNRLEVSQSSEDGELLFRLNLGTVEYDLLRRADLSYNNPDLAALQYRSYLRLCWLVQSQAHQNNHQLPSKDGDLAGMYSQQLADLYYSWSSSYLNLAMSLDRSFNGHDVNTGELLVNDFKVIQDSGLLMITFQNDFENVSRVLSQESSIGDYKRRCTEVDWAIKQVKESFTHKGDLYIYQLTALRNFYNQCQYLAGKYHSYSQPINGNGYSSLNGDPRVSPEFHQPLINASEHQYSQPINGNGHPGLNGKH